MKCNEIIILTSFINLDVYYNANKNLLNLLSKEFNNLYIVAFNILIYIYINLNIIKFYIFIKLYSFLIKYFFYLLKKNRFAKNIISLNNY